MRVRGTPDSHRSRACLRGQWHHRERGRGACGRPRGRLGRSCERATLVLRHPRPRGRRVPRPARQSWHVWPADPSWGMLRHGRLGVWSCSYLPNSKTGLFVVGGFKKNMTLSVCCGCVQNNNTVGFYVEKPAHTVVGAAAVQGNNDCVGAAQMCAARRPCRLSLAARIGKGVWLGRMLAPTP